MYELEIYFAKKIEKKMINDSPQNPPWPSATPPKEGNVTSTINVDFLAYSIIRFLSQKYNGQPGADRAISN